VQSAMGAGGWFSN